VTSVVVALLALTSSEASQYKSSEIIRTDPPPTPSYEDLRAHLIYTFASYCTAPVTRLQNWTCFWCTHPNATEVPPLTVTDIIAPEGLEGMFGYIAYSETEILVVFRGTASQENIWKDIQFFMSPYPGVDGAYVHFGFLTYYLTVAAQVKAAVKRVRAKFPDLPIVTSGHSLGAAISALCSVDLVDSGFSGVKAYSFGQPRIGNEVWTNYVNEKVPVDWRVVNQEDYVPHILFTSVGYRHLATELWFQHDTVNYRRCDPSGEDPTCSDSLEFPWEWSVVMHNLYVGFVIDTGGPNGCPL